MPVIRDADRLTVAEIHERAASLATAAREGTASVDDLTGSTFTVSNLGMLGVEEFSAIINPGEAAILAVSAAIPTPVAVDGAVEVRPVMKLTLSADHRLVDGATGARFLDGPPGAGSRTRARSVSLRGRRPPPWPRPPSARVDGPDSFDLVVLGAGTGGYTAAFRAAQLGLKVALVDADKIGGTCLHRGCIPTKAILESAGLAHRMREDGRRLGVLATDVQPSTMRPWPRTRTRSSAACGPVSRASSARTRSSGSRVAAASMGPAASASRSTAPTARRAPVASAS